MTQMNHLCWKGQKRLKGGELEWSLWEIKLKLGAGRGDAVTAGGTDWTIIQW